MYERMLFCYNGTHDGMAALREGADIALALKAEVHLLSVIDSNPAVIAATAQIGESFWEEEQKEASQILDIGIAFLEKKGLRVIGYARSGDPVTVIADTARAMKANLIVVGHKNRGLVEGWLYPSVSGALIDETPCSILIVHDTAP